METTATQPAKPVDVMDVMDKMYDSLLCQERKWVIHYSEMLRPLGDLDFQRTGIDSARDYLVNFRKQLAPFVDRNHPRAVRLYKDVGNYVDKANRLLWKLENIQ